MHSFPVVLCVMSGSPDGLVGSISVWSVVASSGLVVLSDRVNCVRCRRGIVSEVVRRLRISLEALYVSVKLPKIEE